jgi:hypothetical protein
MTTANVTVVQTEVLYEPTPADIRVTSTTNEVLYEPSNVTVNVASFGVQVLMKNPYEQFQAISSEVLYTPTSNIQVQTVTVEVLLKFVTNNRRRPVYVAG